MDFATGLALGAGLTALGWFLRKALTPASLVDAQNILDLLAAARADGARPPKPLVEISPRWRARRQRLADDRSASALPARAPARPGTPAQKGGKRDGPAKAS